MLSTVKATVVSSVLAIGAVSVAAMATAEFDPILPTPDHRTDVGQYRSLSQALKAHAAVYVGTVESFTGPVGGPAAEPGPNIVVGRVHLKVTKTLRGTPLQRLDVPYARLRSMKNRISAWPDWLFLDQPKPSTHVCVVVVPNTFETNAHGVAAPDGAAAFVMASDKAAAFAPIQQICWLAAQEGRTPAGHTEALYQALTDANPIVRCYAADALIGEYLATEPADVAAALARQFARAQELGLAESGEVAKIASALSWRASSPIESPAVRRAACLVLARLTASEVDGDLGALEPIQLALVENLATAVGGQKFGSNPPPEPATVSAKEVLSGSDIEGLRNALKRMDDAGLAPESTRICREWLGEGKKG